MYSVKERKINNILLGTVYYTVYYNNGSKPLQHRRILENIIKSPSNELHGLILQYLDIPEDLTVKEKFAFIQLLEVNEKKT